MSAIWKWLFGVGLILVLFSASSEARSQTATMPAATEHHGDRAIQQKRLDFIKKAIALGFITDIESNSPITRVRVGKNFLSLSFQEKDAILNVVWAYYKTEDPKKNVVLVIDRNRKQIGEYSPAQGGLKDFSVAK